MHDAPAATRAGRPRWVLALLTVLLSTAGTLAAVEIGLRVERGALLGAPNAAAGPVRMVGDRYPGSWDPLLGFVPTPGFSGRRNAWHTQVTIDADGVRSNGAEPPPGVPVLAVGDSFTFGDEVDDDATWPAQLERLLGRPVVNGGVFGYGLDQMVLRAERLLQRVPADSLVVSIVPEDVLRCEYSYRYAWKPYFELEGGRLALRNVPVPEPHRGAPHEPLPLRWLRRSFLADLLARRLAPDRWLVPDSVRVHGQGPEVARRLVDRLADAAREQGHALLLVVEWIPGSSDAPARAPVERARERGVPVLEMAPLLRAEIDAGRSSVERLFRMHVQSGHAPVPGHMSAEGNRLVARAIAERLRALAAGPRS